MRVALINSGVTYWLAGDPTKSEREHSSAADFRLSGRRLVQEATYVRADAGKALDRGNLLETITFSTWRLFDTVNEADLFVLDYHRTMPYTGTLRLVSLIAGGGESNRYLNDAVIDPPEFLKAGASVQLTYTARGGAISTTAS